jgi:hypothetical protein
MASGSSWSRSLVNFPHLTQDVVDKWANEDAKLPRSKQQKGYSNFIEGYIHEVEGKLMYVLLNTCIIAQRREQNLVKHMKQVNAFLIFQFSDVTKVSK